MPVDLLALSAQLFTAYLLVASRLIGLFATLPMFGERAAPWQVRVGIAMLAAWLLLPLSHTAGPLPQDSLVALGVAVSRELLVGVVVGYVIRLLFAAFQFAVNALDFQMGLSFAQLVNPGADVRLSVLGQFLNTLMLLLFLELDGHHLALRALAQTFSFIPLGQAMPSAGMVEGLIALFSIFVEVSLRLALPAVLVLLLLDLAIGVVGRVVPQLNVFLVSLPVKILVGLATLSVTLPVFSTLVSELLWTLHRDLGTLLRMMV